MNRFYKTVVSILRPIVSVLFKLEVKNAENLQTGGKVLLCCNHQSFWDIVFLLCICPYKINFMAKKELFKFAPLGFIFKKMGAFPVNRAVGDLSAVKHAEEVLNNGGVLGIFPEGTRHKLGAPHKAKAGAAMFALNTRSNILPVAIRYPKKPLLFKRIQIHIGAIIETSKMAGDEISRADIKRVTGTIMQNITNLWETAI